MTRASFTNNRLGPIVLKKKSFDIVCMLWTRGDVFTIPRGRNREELVNMGLVGKVGLNSSMSDVETKLEIASVFWEVLKLSTPEQFTFTYLR